MQFSFRTLSMFTAGLCFALALVWGFIPEVMLSIWSIGYSDATGLVARRSAMLFVALGVMFYQARNTPPSVSRSALSSGLVVAVFGLATLGVGEWLNGHAGPGILLAVAVEIALGLAFLQTRRAPVELAEIVD
ncbi:hypothetical protein C1Y08_24985 [Pseudomonas sp. FW306-02-F02-AA]|uniref:DUF4345 domain-containing protein n=1 Tax=Pseudomonas fluorescens TaxID=294 RepID=A0A0N9VUL4_PSEFL|nr:MULTISPECIES: hypothetical protein [Pseudomonas]ALI04338.1 hypothetical protein AO353_25940 [Pseudomonas fluorescens]PMZ01645.1 hypothetical protein C1Y07_24130 [Pseudomonas sp. FW306-02-F02-AB]PMZ10144.1 hypothetical protein C1Y06_10980 [Pseudomonas sp. FW306-02-H06C]PMZ13203.1 hypothetical protein C1Y08_24985 [Pseudomonas sp. FW306-02-F02-AA]PMZ19247.1 hypothetical protein C1Y09_25050 [Pseudomonas sp. FW306-02-F08-AA]